MIWTRFMTQPSRGSIFITGCTNRIARRADNCADKLWQRWHHLTLVPPLSKSNAGAGSCLPTGPRPLRRLPKDSYVPVDEDEKHEFHCIAITRRLLDSGQTT